MKDEMHDMEPEVDIEPTGEDNAEEMQLEDVEAESHSKIKTLQTKLKACEAEKTELQDELQRARADFLNARKRLEEDKVRDKERLTTAHVEKLLPLYDSFYMAMSNKEAWNAVDEDWRKGVESIYTQLTKLFTSYNVSEVNPTGEEFDPEQHEAMAETPVADSSENNKVMSVIQMGFVRTHDGKTELIRPARVVVGVLEN